VLNFVEGRWCVSYTKESAPYLMLLMCLCGAANVANDTRYSVPLSLKEMLSEMLGSSALREDQIDWITPEPTKGEASLAEVPQK